MQQRLHRVVRALPWLLQGSAAGNSLVVVLSTVHEAAKCAGVVGPACGKPVGKPPQHPARCSPATWHGGDQAAASLFMEQSLVASVCFRVLWSSSRSWGVRFGVTGRAWLPACVLLPVTPSLHCTLCSAQSQVRRHAITCRMFLVFLPHSKSVHSKP